MDVLKGIKVAILIADGFQQIEMTGPKKALEEAGALTTIVSPINGKVKGFKGASWGDEFTVDRTLDQVKSEEFDAIVLPGGSISPDTLQANSMAVDFVKGFISSRKPIAAICRGPLILISANAVKGKKMTSWPSIRENLINAGALWVDEEVVKDDNMITSRNPNDVPVFSKAAVKLFSEFHKN